MSFIDILGFMIISAPMIADYYAPFLPEDEKLFSVYLIANVDLTLAEKKDFGKIVKLLDKYGFSLLHSWLQLAQNLGHEITILTIYPAIVIMSQSSELFLKYKGVSETKKKIAEQKLVVNFILDFFRDLVKNVKVFFHC